MAAPTNGATSRPAWSSSDGRRGWAEEGSEADSPAHGIAYPLLLSPSGSKFGKSEDGESVWLDAERTSPYAFYQYWLNTDDRDVGPYLRWFTQFDRDRRRRSGSRDHEPPPRHEKHSGPLPSTSRARSHGETAALERSAAREAMFAEPAIRSGLDDLEVMARSGVDFRLDADSLTAAPVLAQGSTT